MYYGFLYIGNARSQEWKRLFPRMGTAVSYYGNDGFPLWERRFPAMGTNLGHIAAQFSSTYTVLFLSHRKQKEIKLRNICVSAK